MYVFVQQINASSLDNHVALLTFIHAHYRGRIYPFAQYNSHVNYSTAGSYFQKAKAALLGLQVLDPDVRVEVVEHADREAFRQWWFAFRDTISAGSHSSSPAVWLQGGQVSHFAQPTGAAAC
jgi:hypothetical protein